MNQERDLLWLFDFSLVLKAIDGGLEMVAALLTLLVPPAFILRIVEFATAGELTNDPNDFIATHLRSAAQSFAVHTHYVIAIYLFLHGAVKIGLVLGIFAQKKIAYPLFVVALGIFGAYEAYRGILLNQVFLQLFACFDCMVLILTAYEYRRRYPEMNLFQGA